MFRSCENISRRKINKTLLASFSIGLIPKTLLATEKNKYILWTGVSFIQDCKGDEGVNEFTICEDFKRVFPNIVPHALDPQKSKFLYDELPGQWGASIGRDESHQIVWLSDKTEIRSEFRSDLAMILGITSDRKIAHKAYQDRNMTFMVYEIQSYLFIVDFEKFQIVQSYPIRVLSLSYEPKALTDQEVDSQVRKKMWRALAIDDGSEAAQSRVPARLQEVFKSIDLADLRPAKLRVTSVETTKLLRAWIDKEHPDSGKKEISSKVREKDFKFLLGNSATCAISEKFKIGVLPYTPNVAFGLSLTDFQFARSLDTMQDQKLLMKPPELDIKLEAQGVIFKRKEVKGEPGVYITDCVIAVVLEAGRYKRTLDASGQEEQSAEPLGPPIFKQVLFAKSREKAVLAYQNDWYWAIDLHQRLLDWFFRALKSEGDLRNLTKGEREKFKAREYWTRVKTKDFGRFEQEAKNLRVFLNI